VQTIGATSLSRWFKIRQVGYCPADADTKEGPLMKPRIKIGIIACGVLATALAATLPARAETIFLKCGTFNVTTVDLTKKTVNNNPASITLTSIDWETHGEFVVHLHIDRVAGTETIEHHGQRFAPEPCNTVKKPATKF